MSITEQGVWAEPVRGEYFDPRLVGLPGVERLRASLRGRTPRPPLYYLTGYRPVEAGVGYATFSMPATRWLESSARLFLGGWSAFAADAALGTAVETTLPAGAFTTTAEMSMNFIRPATVDSGTIIARARIIHVRRSLGLSEVFVEDAAGHRLAHGTSRLVVLTVPPPEPPPLDPVPERRYDTPHPFERPFDGPEAPPEIWDEHATLDIYRMAMAGEVPPPPFAQMLGVRILEASEGEIAFAQPAVEWLNNPIGNVFGGSLAVMADNALTSAIATTLPRGSSCATIDLKVQYLRPAKADGRDLVSRASVVHRGKSVAIANAQILNADGKPVALATGSAIIRHGRSWSAPQALDAQSAEPDAD